MGSFIDIGGMVLLLIVAWYFYRVMRPIIDKEEMYENTERVALDEFLKRTKPGIWEHAKLLEAQTNKRFRKRLEEELVSDFFKKRDEEREKGKKLQ